MGVATEPGVPPASDALHVLDSCADRRPFSSVPVHLVDGVDTQTIIDSPAEDSATLCASPSHRTPIPRTSSVGARIWFPLMSSPSPPDGDDLSSREYRGLPLR